MKNTCILCDFDGTITEKDGLYSFFAEHAHTNWVEIEKLWEQNKINSKECLKQEFKCIPDLSEELIENYLKTVKIDPFFKEFFQLINKKNIGLYVVSDGLDYFIDKTLKNFGIKNIEVISNHFEFKNGKKYILEFPNESPDCKKNSGTCKCTVVKKMKKLYEQIIYIGDGTSDYCVCDKADILFAKGKLCGYCDKNNIKYNEFKDFSDIIKHFC